MLAKIYFTDHRTANTIRAFTDSFRSLKNTDVIRIRRNSRTCSYPSDARREQCVDVNNPLQTVFKLYILTEIVL